MFLSVDSITGKITGHVSVTGVDKTDSTSLAQHLSSEADSEAMLMCEHKHGQ